VKVLEGMVDVFVNPRSELSDSSKASAQNLFYPNMYHVVSSKDRSRAGYTSGKHYVCLKAYESSSLVLSTHEVGKYNRFVARDNTLNSFTTEGDDGYNYFLFEGDFRENGGKVEISMVSD
jgi:hypothetical protein